MKLRRMARVSLIIVALAAIGALAVVTMVLPRHHPGQPSKIMAESDQLLPSETLQDWATYSDHLVAFTVTGQRELSPSKDELAAGEGYIPRVVTLRIDDVLWSRDQAPAAPDTFETDLDGWSFHGENRVPVRLAGEPPMNVGDHDVAAITYLDVTDRVKVAGWTVLSPDSIIPYHDGLLGTDHPAGSDVGTIREQFRGHTAADLAQALTDTPPYPAAADAMNLAPDERYALVSRG